MTNNKTIINMTIIRENRTRVENLNWIRQKISFNWKDVFCFLCDVFLRICSPRMYPLTFLSSHHTLTFATMDRHQTFVHAFSSV